MTIRGTNKYSSLNTEVHVLRKIQHFTPFGTHVVQLRYFILNVNDILTESDNQYFLVETNDK